MKNLFTVIKKSEQLDGDKNIVCPAVAFIDRKQNSERAEKNRDLRAQIGRLQKASRLPVPISLIGIVSFFAALGLLCWFLGALDAKSAAEIIEESPWFLPVTISCACIAAAVFVAQKIRLRSVMGSSETGFIMENANRSVAENLSALGVPAEAPEIDVYVSVLSKKSFEAEKSPFRNAYVSLSAYLFAEDGAVCFATVDCVVKVPFDKITAVNLVNKRVGGLGWNKDEPYNKGRYKRYKLRKTNDGEYIWSKPHYRVSLRDGAEEYEIIIPCYDIEPFLQITGKTVA